MAYRSAVRDGLIKPPWMDDQKPKLEPEPAKPAGRPPDYDHAAIATAAENYIRDNGCPNTATLLREKVEDIMGSNAVPGDTVFKKIVNPIWRRHRVKSRKVGK
jgi:hypothetical protein